MVRILDIYDYVAALNSSDELFVDVHTDAVENNVPIMDRDALEVMKHYIHLTGTRHILEIGTAIGYSALHMMSVHPDVSVVTLEKDEENHRAAKANFEKYNVTDRVKPILGDAAGILHKEIAERSFDMLFIDASKGNNQKFFEMYSPFIKQGGLILVDNFLLRGMVVDGDIQSKNRRKMKARVDAFNQHIASSEMFSSFLPVGDGLLVISKNKEVKNR